MSSADSAISFPQYRVKRKPPPTIGVAEKYPSPDPKDPFVPLWVLRNRTSSALGQNPLVNRENPSPYSQPPTRTAYQGHSFGINPDNFKTNSASNPVSIERRRSNSYQLPHPTSTPSHANPSQPSSTGPTHGAKLGTGHTRPLSQSTFPMVGGGVSHMPIKLGQHQVNSNITPRTACHDPKLVAFPPRTEQGPQLIHSQSRAYDNVTHRQVNMRTPDNSSSTDETESDVSVVALPPHHQQQSKQQPFDVKVKSIDVEGKSNTTGLTTTISFNVGVDVKPTLLRRAASNGTSNSGSASSPKNVFPQPQSQSRLAKFLLPKKTSHDGYMADGEKKGSKTITRTGHGPVHKLSISAPLTETFVHKQGQFKPQDAKEDHNSAASIPSSVCPVRTRGGYTSDTDMEENVGTQGQRRVSAANLLFQARKKTSAESTHVHSTRDRNNDQEDVIVIARTAVDVPKPHLPGEGEKERQKAEMSWSEVNFEEYYTPIPSPRRSYPTPAPSPETKRLPELEPDPEQLLVSGDDKKGNAKKENRKVEENKMEIPVAMEQPATVAPIHGPVPSAKDGPTESASKKVQAPRSRKLNLTRTSGITTSNVPIPMATPGPVRFPSPPPTSTSTAFSSSAMPPLPPPKLSKRRISNSTPPQVVATSGSSSHPSHLPSTRSISNTSIVHVSLISMPTSSQPPLSEHEDASAYVKPRRAPRPPGSALSAEVRLEPESVKRERMGDHSKSENDEGDKMPKTESETMRFVKTNSDDEIHAPSTITKRQTMDVGMTEKIADTTSTMKASSRLPKHVKAASTDLGGVRKDKVEAADDGVSKKAMKASASTPAHLSLREKERYPSPLPSQSQPPRSVVCYKAASADHSFQIPLPAGGHAGEYSPLNPSRLSHAASLPLYTEDGHRILFGRLFERQKTVVVFIRHFWCPLCQDYMSVVKSTVRPEMIVPDGWAAGNERGEAGGLGENEGNGKMAERIGFAVISNGAHAMISKYRQIFNLPFKVYTDPSLALYKAMGMGKTDRDCQAGHQDSHQPHPTHYLSDSGAAVKKKTNYSLRRKGGADTSASSLSDREREGGYVKHGLMSGIAMVVARALKVGMPVWEKGGDVGQLGGEFVLGPGLTCTYAHRMQSSKGHAPIEEVLQAAGLRPGISNLPELPPRPSSPPPTSSLQVPTTPKQNPPQKRAESIDLASPPKISKETHQPQVAPRKRRDSFKILRETFIPGRSSTIATNAPVVTNIVPQPPLLQQRPSQRGDRDRRNDVPPASSIPISTSNNRFQVPPPLPAAVAAVMTREEEAHWAEERQRRIEKMVQEKKDVRRVGALGRTPSSQACGGAQLPQGNNNIRSGGYAVQPVSAQAGRGSVESRSAAPVDRSYEDEERILYKPDGRRTQERTRGYVQKVPTTSSKVGHSAGSSKW